MGISTESDESHRRDREDREREVAKPWVVLRQDEVARPRQTRRAT
jgi:hypothetical protein